MLIGLNDGNISIYKNINPWQENAIHMLFSNRKTQLIASIQR